MLFTIDQINPMLYRTAGFTLGCHILDDCDKDTYGLEQAVAFIKGIACLRILHTFHLRRPIISLCICMIFYDALYIHSRNMDIASVAYV